MRVLALIRRLCTPALPFALTAAMAAFALAAFSPGLLNDGDTYWHIRTGQWMLAHGAVPRADPFSATFAGTPWHAAEWLAETLMALPWNAGGWIGIHLLFAAAAAMTALVLGYGLRRQMQLLPALVTIVLGFSCVTGSLLARPHLLSLPLLALWTAGLVQAREESRAPPWWLLPIMVLWANLHASFAFGLALALALGIEAVMQSSSRARTAAAWGLFLAAATAATLATPFGVQTLLFPLRLNAMQGLAHIGEWQPSDLTHISPFLVALLAGFFCLVRCRVQVPPLRLLIVTGLIGLALMHGRHQMLLGICAPLLLAPSLARAWPVQDSDTNRAWPLLAVVGIAALAMLRLAVPLTRGDDAVTPASALAHVPRFVRAMPVLNDYSFGGFLIWNGVRPFIDSRADLYGDLYLRNYADIILPDRAALQSSLAFYHIRWTIFAADAPVVRVLDETPGWHRLYADRVAVVHVHD